MGERHGWLFEPTFNRSIKVRQVDSRITSNAGAVLLREIDHRLSLTADLAAALYDPRDPARTRYTQVELLRQHLYGLALGYAHQDDQDSLAHDVAVKLAVWDRPGRRVVAERLASQPSDWRLVERLASSAQRRGLNEALPVWVGRHQQAAGQGRKVVRGTLDIDPFPIELHGRQAGGAWHGHYHRKMYYPIVASFSAGGDYDAPRLGAGFVHAVLRRGNCGGAEGAVRFVKEAIRKARPLALALDVRIDAGLVEGKTLDAIDDEGACFVGRLKNNAALDKRVEPLLYRPPGRPSQHGEQFALDVGTYQAARWTRPYRLVLVVTDLPDPKTGLRHLFPHHFFLITNWRPEQKSAWTLLEHYRGRGTFEDRLSEFNAVVGSGLPAESFQSNEAALRLKLLAFNLAEMVRGELEAAGAGTGWDLRRVQQTVLRAGARVVEHSRRLFLDVAQAAGALWGSLLDRVQLWWRDPTWGRQAAGRRSSTPGRQPGPRPRPWVPPPAHAHLHLVLRQ
jgi:hypothetical protein